MVGLNFGLIVIYSWTPNINQKLMKPMGIWCSLSLLFTMKVMIWLFFSICHKVITSDGLTHCEQLSKGYDCIHGYVNFKLLFCIYIFNFIDVSIFIYMFEIVQFLFLKTNLNKISIHGCLAYFQVTLCWRSWLEL